MAVVQSYPRLSSGPEQGLLDINALKPLPSPIPEETLTRLIKKAIELASLKASKKAMDIPEGISVDAAKAIYFKKARDLFIYFKKSDPASAFQIAMGKNCRDFAQKLFDKRESHNASMNAGWRYQFLFVECAQASGRFKGVSDISTADSDVNITAELNDGSGKTVNLLVSMKNRFDTISGSKWEGAVDKLESTAQKDKNRTGPYCCIFAIGMQGRKYRSRTEHSPNTELWPANFTWEFVSGHSYGQLMMKVSEALEANGALSVLLPKAFLDQFESLCIKNGLVNSTGVFHAKDKLIRWLTGDV